MSQKEIVTRDKNIVVSNYTFCVDYDGDEKIGYLVMINDLTEAKEIKTEDEIQVKFYDYNEDEFMVIKGTPKNKTGTRWKLDIERKD